ncbi:hypothetical protein F5050DRAFT_1809216 [Lentinula boryana]|uniref:Uncharacterized protein n=1 Tax=Lentinula boryana TaxID=40481 RepID=A0ABQ8Q8H3_9AGAR|nr:hypothetical protein F5050DRAFT_1809216 [Lentinula boryana]
MTQLEIDDQHYVSSSRTDPFFEFESKVCLGHLDVKPTTAHRESRPNRGFELLQLIKEKDLLILPLGSSTTHSLELTLKKARDSAVPTKRKRYSPSFGHLRPVIDISQAASGRGAGQVKNAPSSSGPDFAHEHTPTTMRKRKSVVSRVVCLHNLVLPRLSSRWASYTCLSPPSSSLQDVIPLTVENDKDNVDPETNASSTAAAITSPPHPSSTLSTGTPAPSHTTSVTQTVPSFSPGY